jgi:hypothetical protein
VALLDELRQRRTAAREAADAILTRAQEDTRDLTADELREYQARVVEQREADDAIEEARDRELAEVRAAATRRPAGPAVPREPVLTREQSVEGLVRPARAGRAGRGAAELRPLPAWAGHRPLGRRRA